MYFQGKKRDREILEKGHFYVENGYKVSCERREQNAVNKSPKLTVFQLRSNIDQT